MFDTSFLQVLVFGAVGALLVGPKDLPMVARKFGGILGKGVGVISRTRNSVQSFIRENELTHVQQDFERSLQQIRQVQDEVKQGLTSPIVSAQSIPPYTHTEYSHLSEPARAHSFSFPSNTGYPKTIVGSGAPLGENPQFPYVVKYARAFDASSSAIPKPLSVDLGPPSPEALAWKSTSAEMAPGGADYLLAYAAMHAQRPVAWKPDAERSSHDAPSRPAAS